MRICIFISLIYLSISVTSFAQLDTIKKEVKKDFTTQGEQEEYRAKQVFERKEPGQPFEIYKGKISILNENVIKYDALVLNLYNIPSELKVIFTKGIFHPGIIGGHRSGDTLTIGRFEELTSLSSLPRIKRFKIYLSAKGIINPFLYFLELTNERATPSTERRAFIEGSRITFFKFGSILI